MIRKRISPKPDYERKGVKLYCCDCHKVISVLMQDVALILTDPPYGISHPCNFHSRGRSKLAKCHEYVDVVGDTEPFDPALLLKLKKPTILWGANYYASRLPDSSGWLVWDKLRPDALDQSTCELAWTNCVKGVRRFRHLWHGMIKGSERGKSHHPTQKPVALFTWVLSLPWIPQGLCFDPFMGSGPAGVACARAGRAYIGCEINREYFDIAVKRIDRELDKGRLPGLEVA